MKNKKFYLLLILLLLLTGLSLFAQNEARNSALLDTSFPEISDSLKISVIKTDSLFYKADSIHFEYDTEIINLYGKPKINYQDTEIIADSLTIDIKKERAFSFGPTQMKDGEQLLLGSNVRYDVKTQTGILNKGNSLIEGGYYTGYELRKVDKEIYDIDSGTFTNCDLEEPSFWFWSKQLRVYKGDKIVGKPVIGYVNHFPAFFFPFIIIPIRQGRHPGFLIPSPDYNNVDGFVIRNLAFYYPYRDYADFVLGFDIMEKTGWKGHFDTEYLKRYAFSGSFNAAYQHSINEYSTFDDWSLQGNHHQDLPEKSSLDANINFVSNKRIWESSSDVDQSLAQRLTSSVSYSKPIGSSYLNAGSYFTQDLINDTASLSLPSASFFFANRPVSELFNVSSESWLSNFNYRYNIYLEHTGSLREKNYSLGDFFWDNTIDPEDTTGVTMLNEHHFGIKQNAGISHSSNLFGWLTLGQNFDYTEAWMDRKRNNDKFARGNAWSASANVRFNLYGLRNFNNFPINSVRHIITPNIGYSYQPDTRKNSDLYSFGSIGISNSREASNLIFNLDNTWQMKYGKKGSETKLNDLLYWRMGLSANLKQKDKPFSNIAHTLYFKPGSVNLGTLSLNAGKYKMGSLKLGYSSQFSATQDPYKIKWNEMNLRNQYFSQGLVLSGSAPYNRYFSAPKNRSFEVFESSDTLRTVQDYIQDTVGANDWSFSISHNIYSNKDIFHSATSNLRTSLTCKITQNWRLSYNNYYDLKTNDMLSQTLSLSRDLHCWKMDVNITLRNDYWDYRISLFNTLLPDALKFQTHDSKKY
ncbi:MAG TPA: putative LPS assembly protein LptD [Candidatus Cloacimonas sp.]|nr:putative LPS assembly protein LptD [Candidatus Cloacimonas sp.]